MTIYQEFGHFDGLKVCIAGGLDHSMWQNQICKLKRLGATSTLQVQTNGEVREFEDYGTFVTIDEVIEESR